ncbi:MAG TPA: aldo/keto reductase [Rectinemataceae bacterium]|nr:aldo/keto reductase [Rectinemataceae bacterium]
MIPRQAFGRTGHQSSRLIFGAAALGTVTQGEADRTLGLALEAGLNHFDVAASYGDAEERMGPWLKSHRDEVFLATKTQMRTKKEALAELETSLARLGADHVDLWQMHVLVEEDEWEIAMGEGGALEAFVEARESGKVRFLGVTGHGLNAPAMHLRSLRRFDFDSVLFPWNWPLSRNPDYATAVGELVDECRGRKVAYQLIKAFLRKPWGERPRTSATWYEPLKGPADIAAALGFAWGLDGSFVNSAGDIHVFRTIVEEASKNPSKPSDAAMAAFAARAEMETLFG